MDDNKLHIIPVVEKGQKYDASTGALVLDKEGAIYVTIKQYKEDKKTIEELEKKKKKTQEFARQKWEQRAKEGWSKKKLQENYDANMQEWEKLNKESLAILDKYENINWCWQLVGNKLNHNKLSHNPSFKKGIEEIKTNGTKKVSFPSFLVGGGMAWLEVFHEKEGAKGDIPYGIYVKAIGTPQVLKTEWTDFEYRPITETIGFMSKVILHIYTSDMYGQEVEIQLNDRDLLSFNDQLSFSGKVDFVKEVTLIKPKKNDIGKMVIDELIKNDQSKTDNIVEKEQYIQKIEVEILVDSIWEKEGGKKLKIFPIIKSKKTGTIFEGFDENYLNVDINSNIVAAPNEVSNKVSVVGAVETNESAFHHCQYTGITLEYEKGEKTETVEIFKEEPGVSYNSNVEIGLILGSEPKKFSLKVDQDSDAAECRYAGKDNDHGKKIFSFDKTKLPKNISIGEQSKNLEGTVFFDYERLNMMQYFWLPNNFSKISRYSQIKINALSCRHQNYLNLTILPDIEWELAFIITTMAGFRVKAENTTVTRLNQGLGEYQFRGIKAEQTGKLIEKGGVGYSLNIKYTINGGAFYEQISLDFVKNIEKIIDTYNSIAGFAEIFKVDKKNVTSAAISTSTVKKMTFDIDPPAVVFLLKWKYDYAKKNKQPVVDFTGAAGFKPLIGLKIGVDLVANADKFGGLVGAIIKWGSEFVKELTSLDLYILVETGVALNYDIGLSYNEIDGFAPNTKQKAVVDLTFTIKAGIKKKEVIFIANVSQMEGNTIPTNEADQETFKVEGAATTGIRYTEEHGIEKGKGNYKKVDVKWLGAEITITLVTMAHKRKINSPSNQQFKEKFLLLSPKTIYGPETTYTQSK
ncbi:hypothetical protein [Flavobacterium hercynium]|uniref:Uncharacterized protein n=1 Tax=Flavobacterium hercynium TaxID=387094 RepID=A0A226GVR6_9FLAO|nr:hypothetical protein [Flavobacterium hercynium]OXA85638.1 hypothetical protein B0A66_19115 [Flavobacterium hercynium]SMP36908.1 hypothetical protein SAMN06265346_12526 [Flavobacterium hercynium]